MRKRFLLLIAIFFSFGLWIATDQTPFLSLVHFSRLSSTPIAPTPTTTILTQTVLMLPTATPLPASTLRTTTGQVKQIQVKDQRVSLQITPDDPGMKTSFEIQSWDGVNVLYYWQGIESPVSVAKDKRAETVAQKALNHQVVIGYYAIEPAQVVMISIHKQKGDPQK
jgi:hypothetical protein